MEGPRGAWTMDDVVEKSLEGPLELSTEESPQKKGELVEILSEDKVKFDDTGLSLILHNGLETLRVENALTDVILCVDIQEFSCHRVVLAAASNYFRSACLGPNWKESGMNVGAPSNGLAAAFTVFISLLCADSRYSKDSN